MSTGLATLAAAGRNARKRSLRRLVEHRHATGRCASHASAARIAGPPALVTIATRRPPGHRLVGEHGRHVEQLLERARSDHARLTQHHLDQRFAGGARAGVRRGRARPGVGAARLDRDDRLGRGRRAARSRRTCAGCRSSRDTDRMTSVRGSSAQYLQQVVARDVGLVADRGEAGDADIQPLDVVEDGQAERAALRRERDPPGGRVDGRERRVHAKRRIGVQDPHAVGADHAHAGGADLLDQLVLQRASLRRPTSPKPALITTSARTPLARQSSTTAATCGRRHDDDGQIDVAGNVADGGYAAGRRSRPRSGAPARACR